MSHGNVDQTKWEPFTLTMRNPLLMHRIEEFSGNLPGTGALLTFKDSSWLISIVMPHQPHFAGQLEDFNTLWGYGSFIDEPDDHITPTMSQATGQEILTEFVHHLGFEDALEQIRVITAVTLRRPIPTCSTALGVSLVSRPLHSSKIYLTVTTRSPAPCLWSDATTSARRTARFPATALASPMKMR